MKQLPSGWRALPLAVLIMVGACSLLGHFGAVWWPFDILANFRVQYFVILCAALFGAAALRQPRTALVALVFVVVNGVLTLRAPLAGFPSAVGPPALTMLSANVKAANSDYARLLSEIVKHDPDVLIVLELTPAWAEVLERALPADTYPTRRFVPRTDAFGIALIAKLPASTEVITFAPDDGPPSIVARVAAGARTFTLVATHPVPPASSRGAALRDQQLAAIATFAAQTPDVIVAGDLNATPWSAAFRALIDVGLDDTREGFGIHATWPTSFFPLRVPIDHVLVSPALVATRREVLPDIGSDHFPIFVALRQRVRSY